MEGRRLVIAMPVRKDELVDVKTAAFCAQAIAQPPPGAERVSWITVPSDFCELGRNAIVAAQLDEVEHFFFLDADTVPPEHALRQLLSYHLPMVGAVVPFDMDGPRWNVWDSSAGNYWLRRNPLPELPFQTERVGGAALLVQADVCRQLAWPWFKTIFRRPTPDNPDGVQLTDDEWFCHMAQEAGFDVWADPTLRCRHYPRRHPAVQPEGDSS